MCSFLTIFFGPIAFRLISLQLTDVLTYTATFFGYLYSYNFYCARKNSLHTLLFREVNTAYFSFKIIVTVCLRIPPVCWLFKFSRICNAKSKNILNCCPPDSKASWPFWRDFWGPKMLQNPNFPGLRPGPRWGSLHCSLSPPIWWGGGSCLRVSVRVQPSTELATLLMINFKCRPIWSWYFFGFGERRKWTQWWRGRWGN